MWDQTNTTKHDHAPNIFASDGRIYQIEYAREAVALGAPAIGITFKDGVVLATVKRSGNKLVKLASVHKIFSIDDHISVAVSGMIADGMILVEAARTLAANHTIQYGEPITIEAVVNQMSAAMVCSTRGGDRPFGVGCLLAGITESGPVLYEIDPSGSVLGLFAGAIGSGRNDANGKLVLEYSEGMDREAALKLAGTTLVRAGGDVSEETLEVIVLSEAGDVEE